MSRKGIIRGGVFWINQFSPHEWVFFDEPEESVEHEDIDFIDYEDLEYVPGQEIFHSNDYYPSIKGFTGTASHIAENAPLKGHEPIDYFNLFLDDNLLDRIIQQTKLYQSRNLEPLGSIWNLGEI